MKGVACLFALQCCFSQVLAFICDGKNTSLPENSICSGLSSCANCSNAQNCTHSGRTDFVSCRDVQPPNCIREDQLCDNQIDCGNCFDEINCTNLNFFFCDNGNSCVDFFSQSKRTMSSAAFFCDGIPQCSDSSDEKYIGFGFKCVIDSSSFRTGLMSSRCILPQKYLGRPSDQVNICRDGSDQCFFVLENGIRVFNESSCWTCLDGTIIQREQMCDNVFDCPDLSDECLCFRNITIRRLCRSFLNNSICTDDQVSCPSEKKCIDVRKICDGRADCLNNADEENCQRNNEKNCGVENAFQCFT